jgi:hypothetical protein
VTPEAFAHAVKTEAFDSAVEVVTGTLRDGPPGRRPSPRSVAMSAWYAGLEDSDRAMVTEVIRDATHSAVFGVLCMLDGVRVADGAPHAGLELTASAPDGGTTVLASSRSASDLHDEFNAVVHPPSEPWPAPAEQAGGAVPTGTTTLDET